MELRSAKGRGRVFYIHRSFVSAFLMLEIAGDVQKFLYDPERIEAKTTTVRQCGHRVRRPDQVKKRQDRTLVAFGAGRRQTGGWTPRSSAGTVQAIHCSKNGTACVDARSGMADEIGVGIIGFGLATRVFHAPFVTAVPGLKLVAIVQRTGDEAARAYPTAKIVRSVEDLLGDKAIRLVVVATPNETHFTLAKQALEAGKHVVIDKPFAGTSAEASELLEVAARMQVLVCPFHNRRWDGDFMTVKKILAEGSLGRLVTFESHFDRYRPMVREGSWKEADGEANGLLMDLGPHLVDQCVALFGMPKTVTASVRTDRDGSQVEDAFDIRLGYDRLLAWCRSSMLACTPSSRFLLHGTAGSFRKDGLDPQEPRIVAGAKVPPMGDAVKWLEEDESMWGTLAMAPNLAEPATLTKTTVKTVPGDYRCFYANVRDAVLGEAKLMVPSQEGFNVVRLLELARQSSREGRTVAV